MNASFGPGRAAAILVVEDNPNDELLTRLAFQKAKSNAQLHHVQDGEECLAFLRKQGPYAAAPTPDLILLDLNMPRMDGREVLMALSADEQLRHLPVVILTTSSEPQEVLKLYQLRCSSYIVKPVDFKRFVEVIRLFSDYWLSIVALPALPHQGRGAGSA